jgi:hypothetical protein
MARSVLWRSVCAGNGFHCNINHTEDKEAMKMATSGITADMRKLVHTFISNNKITNTNVM